MYMIVSFLFFGVGGVEALLMRAQLAQPNGTVLSPEAYDQLLETMALESALVDYPGKHIVRELQSLGLALRASFHHAQEALLDEPLEGRSWRLDAEFEQFSLGASELDAVAKTGSREQLLFDEFAHRLHLRLVETVGVEVTQDAFAALLEQRLTYFRQWGS